MLRLSACIEMLFRAETDDIVERVRLAARHGAAAVEFWSWRSKDLEQLAGAARAHHVAVAGFTVEPRGTLTDPSTHEEFLTGVRESCAVAQRLSAPVLIVLAGQERASIPREEQRQHVIEALRAAAPIAEQAGVTLCLEPLNTRVDHAGYFLTEAAEGFAIVSAVDNPCVRLLYDIYHQQVTEGRLIESLREGMPLIGHIHVADVPGRHEPGTGEINYRNVFRAIEQAGYQGFIGLEFRPSGSTASALTAVHELIA